MKTNSDLRALAREQLKGSWGPAVVTMLVYSGISVCLGFLDPPLGTVLTFVLTGPLSAGLYGYFLKLKRRENPALSQLFSGFSRYGSTFLLYLLISIFTFLWTLLLIIPGIIAALSYSQAFFILMDEPGVSAQEAIRRSKALMHGYKGKLFLLSLSFIGWALLSILTMGIGFLWLGPYLYTTYANFYDELKKEKETSTSALPLTP